VPTSDFIPLAAWLDIVLVLAAGAALAKWTDSVAGPLFVFLWAINPLNDHAYVGGAYLRSLHVLALLAALATYALRRFVASGALLAVASLLRVFPVLLLAGLLGHCLIHRDRRGLLRRHAPLFASAAVTALLLLAATSLLRPPEGGNPWAGFARKMALHSGRISPNVLGLGYLFFYSEDRNVAAIQAARAAGRPLNWVVETERTFAERRPWSLGATALFLAALFWLMRRGEPPDGIFAGLVLVYILLHIAHYDYVVLSLVPFIYPGRRDVIVWLSVFFAAAAAARILPQAIAVLDFRFYMMSLLTGIFLAGLLARRLVTARRPWSAGSGRGP
jgi:hypothetical protein